MKRIAIVTPGGDAPGMNACTRAVVRRAVASGLEVCGIVGGYQGLIDGNIISMGPRSVSGIIHHGGTVLKSSRCSEIKTPQGMAKAVDALETYMIDYLVVIGGDGSIRAAEKISKSGIYVIGVPASIDNDVFGTDETIGFDTAIDTAVDAIDKIRDTATSFDRVFIVEVMGREHGFLALEIGLASGAEFVFVPEVKYPPKKIRGICDELKKDQKKQKTSVIIVFAEGCGDANALASRIQKATGISARVSNLGYIQRGGNPSARSRNLAGKFGSYAVDLILKSDKNKVVVLQGGRIKAIPIHHVTSREKKIDRTTLQLIEKLAV
ncbi:MAG: 6-phosphofructokinase [Elusimicrobia bacterium]|nr:6-phosphofructokinase [Elusimicrobiota bacterium]